MEEWELFLNKILKEFEESELVYGYIRTLSMVKQDFEAKRILDDYRNTGMKIKEKQVKGLDICLEELESHKSAVREFEENVYIKNFLNYDYQIVQLVDSLDLKLREKIKTIFNRTYY